MKKHTVLLIALLAAVVLSALNLAFNEHLGSDTANYYTRMAHEFSHGNFPAAFFHIVPPLTPTLAGLAGKAGLDGWQAMKLVSSLFFIASVLWCYRLARLRLDAGKAQWCALLYVFCSNLLRYGMGGQLDAAKMFLLLFVFERLLVWLDARRWRQLIALSLGAAFLALARNEGVGYLLPVFGLLFLADWIVPDKAVGSVRRMGQGLGRCLFVLVICLAVWSPWIAYQHSVTGYAVLSSKHIAIVGKLMPWLDVENSAYMQEVERRFELMRVETPSTAEKPGLLDGFKDPQPCTIPFKLIETVEGTYPRYLIFAVIGIISLLRNRTWCRMDALLAVLFVFHVFIYWVLSPNILKRLIIPGIPFYFPWMVIGAVAIAGTLKIDWSKKVQRGILIALAAVLGTSQLSSGMSSMRKSLRGKDDLEMEIAAWVRQNRDALDTNSAPPLKSGLFARDYHTGHQPVVLGFQTIPFRARCDAMLQDALPGASHEQFVALCEEKGLDAIITTDEFHLYFPGVDFSDSRFRPLEHPWQEHGIQVLTFNPANNETANP